MKRCASLEGNARDSPLTAGKRSRVRCTSVLPGLTRCRLDVELAPGVTSPKLTQGISANFFSVSVASSGMAGGAFRSCGATSSSAAGGSAVRPKRAAARLVARGPRPWRQAERGTRQRSRQRAGRRGWLGEHPPSFAGGEMVMNPLPRAFSLSTIATRRRLWHLLSACLPLRVSPSACAAAAPPAGRVGTCAGRGAAPRSAWLCMNSVY